MLESVLVLGFFRVIAWVMVWTRLFNHESFLRFSSARCCIAALGFQPWGASIEAGPYQHSRIWCPAFPQRRQSSRVLGLRSEFSSFPFDQDLGASSLLSPLIISVECGKSGLWVSFVVSPFLATLVFDNRYGCVGRWLRPTRHGSGRQFIEVLVSHFCPDRKCRGNCVT